MIALESGNKLAKINLATNEVYKNQKGEKVTNTQWHKCIAWGKLAENMVAFLEKGQEVAVHGKVTYRNYTNKEGKSVYTTEIVLNEFMMVGKRMETSTAQQIIGICTYVSKRTLISRLYYSGRLIFQRNFIH